MSSYPMSNNSWATKPVLTAGSQTQSEPHVIPPSSPPSLGQDSSHPGPESPTLLSLLPQTQDTLQVDDSPEDLGRLISHKVDSIEDIRSGFQFAPHQVARSTVCDTSRTKPTQVSPVNNQQPGPAHSVHVSAEHSHFDIKKPADKQQTPAPGSPGNPKSFSSDSGPSSKTDPPLEPLLIGKSGQEQGHQDNNVGGSHARMFSDAEAIHTSIEYDDEQCAEDHDIIGNSRICHGNKDSQDHQQKQVLQMRHLLKDGRASSENEMPIPNGHSSQPAKKGAHEGNRQPKHLIPREAQPQQNPRNDIVTDLTFTAPSKPSSSPHHHKRQTSSKTVQSKRADRPMVKSKPKDPPLRPVSRESNISKRRIHRDQARITAASPHLKLKRQVNEHKKGLAYSWNDFFGLEHQYTEALECKIDNLKESIDEYEYIVEQLRFETKAQSQTIEELSGENSNLCEALSISKERLDERTLKVQELSEKCREYKKHLNDAIVEQQRLYTKSKRNVQSIVDQLMIEHQAFQKSRDDTTSKLLQDSESAREALMTKVNRIVSEARQDTAELNKTIAVLRTELSERQRELAQERENAGNIQRELEKSRQIEAETLLTLTSQNNKILEAIKEGKGTSQDSLQISKEQTRKLDALSQSLEDLLSQVSSQTVITDELATARKDIMETVSAEVQKLDSKVSDIEQNEVAVDTKIGEIVGLCHNIDECLKSNEGALHWQQKYHEIENRMRDAILQRDEQIDAAQEAMKVYQHLFDENIALASQVASLKRQMNELQIEVQAVRDSKSAEIDRLMRLLTEKDISIKDLITRLKESEATCKEQGEALGNAEVDRERLQQAVETAYKQRDQSISDSIRKETNLLQEKHQETERRLTVSDEARVKLEAELQRAKDQMQQFSTGELDNLKKLLKEDIRQINHVIGDFTAVRIEMEGMGPVTQWIESRARLEDQQQILKRDFVNACQAREKWSETVAMDEVQFQLLSVQLQAGSESQASSGAPDRVLSLSAAPSSDVARARRVIVRSPVEEAIPLAPSVFEEREIRRVSQPLKSSIRSTRRVSRELSTVSEGAATSNSASQEAQKTQKPGLTIHSSFNRPVQGMHKRRQEEPAATIPTKRTRQSIPNTKTISHNRQTRSMSIGIRGAPGEETGGETPDMPTSPAGGLTDRALRPSEGTHDDQGPAEHGPTSTSSSEKQTFGHGSDA